MTVPCLGGDKSDLLAEGVFPEELTYLGQEPAWVGGCSFLQPLSLPSPGTPKGVDFTTVRDLLLSVEGVEALHSLHIWALTVAQPVLSVHIAIAQNADAQAVLKAASACLQGKFHFHTMTIQIEDYSEDMKECQACQGPSD
nr:zinc transporter 2-like [Manis javanica]